jgi:DNA (cytosine-5)-methyltransferase 1
VTRPRFSANEFFAGMGLVRLALEAVGGEVRYANDIDPLKERLYGAMFADSPGAGAHFDRRDINEVKADELPRADVWTASFPCTDVSLAGGRAGIHAGQSGAVWGLLELLEKTPAEHRPKRLLFENVMGLLSSNGGGDLRALVMALNGLGYGVDMVKADASWFTAQSRPRLFLIASPADELPRADVETITPDRVRHQSILDAMRKHDDLIWHARATARLPERGATLNDVVNDPPERDALWWDDERTAYFLAQVHPGHVEVVERMRAGETFSYATAFRRVRAVGKGKDAEKKSVVELRTDGIAGCLRLPKGGSAKQMLLRAGKGTARVRYLTPGECAALQGVDPARLPQGFRAADLLTGLGDAVCVPAVSWVLENLVLDFDGDTTRSSGTASDAPSAGAAR